MQPGPGTPMDLGPSRAQDAQHVVLNTSELLELILVRLDPRTLLLAQRVSCHWRTTIHSSNTLQRALFLRPDGIQRPIDPYSPRRFNPLLVRHLAPWFWYTERQPADAAVRVKVFSRPGHDGRDAFRQVFGYAACAGLKAVPAGVELDETDERDRQRRRAFERPEASWRRMLMQQPAGEQVRYVRVAGVVKDGQDDDGNQVNSTSRRHRRFMTVDAHQNLGGKVACAGGVRMADMYAAVEDVLKKQESPGEGSAAYHWRCVPLPFAPRPRGLLQDLSLVEVKRPDFTDWEARHAALRQHSTMQGDGTRVATEVHDRSSHVCPWSVRLRRAVCSFWQLIRRALCFVRLGDRQNEKV